MITLLMSTISLVNIKSNTIISLEIEGEGKQNFIVMDLKGDNLVNFKKN